MGDNEMIIMGVGQRDPNSWTEKYLRQMYAELPFDMNLVAANEKKIPVHSFVLMMFSAHLRKKFKTEIVFERGMDGKCFIFNVCYSNLQNLKLI